MWAGHLSSPGIGTSFKYTGQRQAEAGLYFYNARYYDPELGRFIQADTIIPEPGNPLAWDRYAYANNNPLIYTDPSGHKACNGWDENGECIPDDTFMETNNDYNFTIKNNSIAKNINYGILPPGELNLIPPGVTNEDDIDTINCHFNPYYASGLCGDNVYIGSGLYDADLKMLEVYRLYGIDIVDVASKSGNNPLSMNQIHTECSECFLRILFTSQDIDLSVILSELGMKMGEQGRSNYEPSYLFFLIMYNEKFVQKTINNWYFSDLWEGANLLLEKGLQGGPD